MTDASNVTLDLTGDLDASYHALRGTGGWWERSRDLLLVSGPDAATYLQGQLSQDVVGLAEGSSSPSFLLQPDGKVTAWLRVTRTGPEAFALDVEAGWGPAVVERLRRFLLRVKVVHRRAVGADCPAVIAVRGIAADAPAALRPVPTPPSPIALRSEPRRRRVRRVPRRRCLVGPPAAAGRPRRRPRSCASRPVCPPWAPS